MAQNGHEWVEYDEASVCACYSGFQYWEVSGKGEGTISFEGYLD